MSRKQVVKINFEQLLSIAILLLSILLSVFFSKAFNNEGKYKEILRQNEIILESIKKEKKFLNYQVEYKIVINEFEKRSIMELIFFDKNQKKHSPHSYYTEINEIDFERNLFVLMKLCSRLETIEKSLKNEEESFYLHQNIGVLNIAIAKFSCILNQDLQYYYKKGIDNLNNILKYDLSFDNDFFIGNIGGKGFYNFIDVILEVQEKKGYYSLDFLLNLKKALEKKEPFLSDEGHLSSKVPFESTVLEYLRVLYLIKGALIDNEIAVDETQKKINLFESITKFRV